MTEAESLYISASTNRHSHAADISSTSLVCFASQKTIALWDALDPTDAGVTVALRGHQIELNCVRFMQGDKYIVSGDQNGTLQIRTKVSGKWRIVEELAAHTKPISALATHETLVVTGSSDATVKIWTLISDRDNEYLELVQSLDMKGKFPLDLRLTAFPETSCLILAIANTGRDVAIWTGNKTQFIYTASLSGHEDWVKSLAFTRSRRSPPQLTLASGSQDGIIRLWTVDQVTQSARPHASGDDMLDAFEASLSDFAEGEEGGRQMSTKRHAVAITSLSGRIHHFTLALDALLIGHEAGITSLSWCPATSGDGVPPTLLSASVDSSLILWSPSSLLSSSANNDSVPLWINQQRFGDVGGQRFGGFVGGLWADGGREVMGWGWSGGWRRWRCQPTLKGQFEVWEEVGAITGHQGVVKSIAWDSRGDYILSAAFDQTTRIHGPHRRMSLVDSSQDVWHELARPQVHGYDIVGAEFISPLRFVSIADEKVARVFDAPKNFAALVNTLGAASTTLSTESLSAGANIPPLGLSNKAVADGEALDPDTHVLAKRCPFESELVTMTLWPEIEKIFGHGYELISMATSHSGSFVVTACKSTTAEHAVLRVYNTKDWQLVGEPLGGHTLTATRITFSPDDRMILSVSRDRSWRIFSANANDSGYSPLAMDKSHGRIIWDCAWMHEVSDIGFATASRDKTIKIWRPVDLSLSKWTAVATLKFKEAATAIDFSPVLNDGRRRLAVGLENGDIFVYSLQLEAAHNWLLELTVDPQLAHADTINRILWRPSEDRGPTQHIATCSEDRTTRVITVHLDFH